MCIINFDVFVRKNDSCIIINSLITSFTSESGVSSETGLSNVIHYSCSLDFDQMVLLGLN